MSSDLSDVWFWQEALGWFWTNRTAYPFLYVAQSNGWRYYLPDSGDPRWFYDFTTA